jgi:hypothetical protein
MLGSVVHCPVAATPLRLGRTLLPTGPLPAKCYAHSNICALELRTTSAPDTASASVPPYSYLPTLVLVIHSTFCPSHVTILSPFILLSSTLMPERSTRSERPESVARTPIRSRLAA